MGCQHGALCDVAVIHRHVRVVPPSAQIAPPLQRRGVAALAQADQQAWASVDSKKKPPVPRQGAAEQQRK